jgi:hypothetical protein
MMYPPAEQRRRRRKPVCTTLIAFALVGLTACSSSSPSVPQTSAAPMPTPTASPITRSASPPASSSSGELTKLDLPKPADLGPGWRYRVDPGNGEGQSNGDGTPALARDPSEVVSALQPLGCPRENLPLPAHALEVTYQNVTQPGVALLLEFSSDEQAGDFFTTHTQNLQQCAELSHSPVSATHLSGDTFRYVRHETHSPAWVEQITVDGDRVLFVARGATR